MCKLLALLALVVVDASGSHLGSVSSLPSLPSVSIAPNALFAEIPAVTTTCRTRPIGQAIYNQCPSGHTLISSGECCPTQQVLPSPTSHSTCFDKANANGINECPGWKGYCKHMFYKSYMTHHCPQTCGLCPATTATCEDTINATTGRSECSANIGLCNNAAFRDWMKIQCPRTCGYCQ